MRARLIGILVLVLLGTVASISVPLAVRFASSAEQGMFLDRLEDADHFASVAEQSVDDADAEDLQAQLTRYHEVFGISAAIVDRGLSVMQGAGSVDLDVPAVADAVQRALSGHQSSDPAIIWFQPVMAVAVPISHGDDVIGAAVTISPTDRLRADLLDSLALLLTADIVAIALFALVASRLATWVLHPVLQLNSAIVKISGGDLGTRAPAERGPVEIRTLAASFNRMVDEVQRVLDSQQAFVANASHQLRNPLTALSLRVQTLGLDLPPDQRDQLEEILVETDRLNTIVDQLLELAKVQGGLAVDSVVTDVVPLLRGRADAWRPRATRSDVELRLVHPASAPALINPALTGSILDTLFDNAIKFSPHGGWIDISLNDEPDGVSVAVRDQGPGIDEREFDRIGERFWRSAATSHVPGSGLGLSIALGLAEAVGARLHFERAEPSGLLVRLRLPKEPAPNGVAC
jgi:signal transduction histidine kinase